MKMKFGILMKQSRYYNKTSVQMRLKSIMKVSHNMRYISILRCQMI